MSAGIYSSKTNTRQQRMEIVRFAKEADITDKTGTTMASNLQIYPKRLVHCNLESQINDSVQLFFLKHFLQSVCFLWKYLLFRKSCLFGISRVVHRNIQGWWNHWNGRDTSQPFLIFFFTFYCSLEEFFFCIWQPQFLEIIDTNQILKASASPIVHVNIKL